MEPNNPNPKKNRPPESGKALPRTRRVSPGPIVDPPAVSAPPRQGVVGDLIRRVVARMPAGARVHESLALAYWPRVAGPQAAAATEAEIVRDGVLIVRTKSSVWSHELSLYKQKLIQGLNELLGGKVIKDIVFKARGISKKSAPPPQADPTAEELDAVPLTVEDNRELETRMVRLRTLSDERVRESLGRRVLLEAKLRRWRLDRGWKVCPGCKALHNTEYDTCPICRLSP